MIEDFFRIFVVTYNLVARSHIFDWIFFDDSSSSKLGSLELQGERQQNVPLGCISTTDWLGMCDIFPAWAFVLLIRVKGSQGLDKG